MERDQLVKVVTAAQKGDKKALDTLFNAYYNDVYYFALKTVKNEDLACDITQETFVEIIRTIGELQAPEAFVTWMRKITYHQCTRYFKKKKDVLVEEDEDGNTVFDSLVEENAEFIPDAALDQAEFRKTVLDMLDTLSEEQRAAVLLYYFDELSVAQIARIQGVSEGTVKSRLNYARKALKKSVEDYEKKTGVKLHSFGILPLLLWLFKDTAKVMPVAAAKAVAGGVATATGVGVTAGVATAAATTAGVAVGTKIAAGVIAAALLVGGGTTAGILLDQNKPALEAEETTTTVAVTTEAATAPTEPVIPENAIELGIVPADCCYIDINGKEYHPGEKMPEAAVGDELHTPVYVYKLGHALARHNTVYGWTLAWEEIYDEGWGVRVKDTEQVMYPALLEQLNGYGIINLNYTFENCGKMLGAPAIPASVMYLDGAFYGCKSMVLPPELPDGIISLFDTFSGCESLLKTPYIPEGVVDMTQTFHNCRRLTQVTNLPDSVVVLTTAFAGCSSLITVPEIPARVEYLEQTFMHCSSLTTVSVIPNASLIRTFSGCTSLTGVIEINSNSYYYFDCGDACPDCARWYTCETCESCNQALDIFKDTVLPIQLTGTCPSLRQIADRYENVTLAE